MPLDGAEVARSRGRPDIRRTFGRGRGAGLPAAEDIARVETPIVSGTMVNIPANKGRNTRWNRCLTSDPRPRLWSNIALKKPLMTKNSGIRKPWMAEKTIPKAESCRRSVTIQYDGKNEREACRTIPSSMATARRASRSDRRVKAWFSVLMEYIRPTPLDIEPGLPGQENAGSMAVHKLEHDPMLRR